MTDTIDLMLDAAQDDTRALGIMFEHVVRAACRNIPRLNDHVIDVGANRGLHTISLAQTVGRKGKVHAFEPLSGPARNLKRLANIYGLSNIQLNKNAVSNESGPAEFHHFEKRQAYSGLQKRSTPFSDEEGGLKKIRVNVTTLDESLRTVERASFLKLDIEGGEFYALQGGRLLIERSRPVIVFENGRTSAAQTYGFQKEDFFAFFESLDMQVFSVTGLPLTRDNWHKPHACWEHVALPKERVNEIERFKAWPQCAVTDYKTLRAEGMLAEMVEYVPPKRRFSKLLRKIGKSFSQGPEGHKTRGQGSKL